MTIKISDFDKYNLLVEVGGAYDRQTWKLELINDKEKILILKILSFELQGVDKHPFVYSISSLGKSLIEYDKLPEDYKILVDDIQKNINNNKIDYDKLTEEDKVRRRA